MPASQRHAVRGDQASKPLPVGPLKVVDIDDYYLKKRRRIVMLLPDREPATAQAWFAAHPTNGIIARDRCGGYGEAAADLLIDF